MAAVVYGRILPFLIELLARSSGDCVSPSRLGSAISSATALISLYLYGFERRGFPAVSSGFGPYKSTYALLGLLRFMAPVRRSCWQSPGTDHLSLCLLQ